MLNVAMMHFQSYIKSKKDKFALSILDLLYVSNFKGGNASITEPEAGLSTKLKSYEALLHEIDSVVQDRKLVDLSNTQLERFKARGTIFLRLTQADETNIRGFGAAYASAMLAAYFIDVAPVLDRRALNGAIVNGAKISVDCDKQGQVRNICSHYEQLVDAFHSALSKENSLSLRELDKRWFSLPLASQFRRRG